MTCVKQKSNKILLQEQKRKKQGCDEKTYSKLVLKGLKVMWDSTSIYTHWAFNSKNFFKKLSTYIWPMFTHVQPMLKLIMNYKLIISKLNELRFNYELIKNKLKFN
jgi:hypothetical protein